MRFPESHPLHLGMPGMHGEVHVNRAIQQADLIIGVGLRFDDRVTGNLAAFARGAKVIHIELDPSEIGKNVPVAVGLVGDARERAARAARGRRAAELRRLAGARSRASCGRASKASGAGCRPRASSRRSSEATGGRCTIVSDVGQHQMWVAKLFRYQRPNTHITSGGLGTMGFAVPAAMGVALARPDEPVWAISGDGGFQMNMQEMATMVQERIPVKMAIFNNGYLGMVRQWQQFFHGRRYSATPIWSPDYVAARRGVRDPGLAGRARRPGGRRAARGDGATGPALIEFIIEQEANVFPMIPPGASLSRADRGRRPDPRHLALIRMSATHAVTVLLEDRLITFNRAVGLLRRRNLPVRSIAVGPTATAGRLEADDHDPIRTKRRRSAPCSICRR